MLPEQDLETQLRSSLVRTGSGVSIAEDAIAGQRSVPARLAQFGEAQRIIVLDAVRTDFASGAARTETAGALNGAINGVRGLPARAKDLIRRVVYS